MSRILLLRYDTERGDGEQMAGFFDHVVPLHREEGIPATFFCLGAAIEKRAADFGAFYREVKGDALFDIQDHSYSHIGVAYESGPAVEELRADYEKSFAVHEKVFGVRPIGVSLCGTSGRDGASLNGFDQTEKGIEEFEMLMGLGVKMVNTCLLGHDRTRDMINYGRLGRPDVMGFPSEGRGDTAWMRRREFGDPMEYIRKTIDDRAEEGENVNLSIVMHDWVAWNYAPDKELTHVRMIADYARKRKFELVTHLDCYRNEWLWKG